MDFINSIAEITPLSEKDTFYIAVRKKENFTFPIHCHKEYELTFSENVTGVRRVVGDSAEVINDSDLVLITGKELEHAWEQHECKSKEIHEITIQFSSDLIPQSLLEKNQFFPIKRMIERAQKGLCFPLETIKKIRPLLLELAKEEDGFYATIKLWEILYQLSLCEKSRTLASQSFSNAAIHTDSRRVHLIQNYINAHFQEEIRLEHLAQMVDMNTTAFSRFFKQRTGKSLSDYIISIRLGHAARLLLETNQSISEISYACGFNNLSNFNRLFKKYRNCTPKEFKHTYTNKNSNLL
ncbi:MAG: helix-turn-helix domain-containing protein [Paludibacteraceae bacterium]|nr:helix-turn-helix domain-containing protein [Bacteroidales bacterium]MBO5132407.1 helix-turn-helix domain-containing protein [Paludibacteraceae bacterium]MBQ9100681.1 helix-turn-helix domain-containing protein [Paludibacteraceae bacterium]